MILFKCVCLNRRGVEKVRRSRGWLRSPVSFRPNAESQRCDFQRRWAGPAALKIYCPWRQWDGRRCCPWRRHTCLTPCALSSGSRCTIMSSGRETTGRVFELRSGHVTAKCFNVRGKLLKMRHDTNCHNIFIYIFLNAWKRYVIALVAILWVCVWELLTSRHRHMFKINIYFVKKLIVLKRTIKTI